MSEEIKKEMEIGNISDEALEKITGGEPESYDSRSIWLLDRFNKNKNEHRIAEDYYKENIIKESRVINAIHNLIENESLPAEIILNAIDKTDPCENTMEKIRLRLIEAYKQYYGRMP